MANAVKALMALKEQYRSLTGTEYKPAATASASASAPASASASASKQKENQAPAASASLGAADQLVEKVTQQGEKVRELKSNKAAKVSE